MGHTIVGVFRHSGDADLAAAHLQGEYALTAEDLDVIGPTEWDRLSRPAPGDGGDWVLASLTGVGLSANVAGDEDPIGKRWGDQVWQGATLIVARANDPDVAMEIARELRQTGADRIDVLPH